MGLTHTHRKSLTRQAQCQRSGGGYQRELEGKGGDYPTGKLSWVTSFWVNRLQASQTVFPSQAAGSRAVSPCELCKASLAGQAASLAGREKTFLVSLPLADKITTVLTSCSCSNVLSSHRDLIFGGLSFFSWCALCKKSERFSLVFHCGAASLVATWHFLRAF